MVKVAEVGGLVTTTIEVSATVEVMEEDGITEDNEIKSFPFCTFINSR